MSIDPKAAVADIDRVLAYRSTTKGVNAPIGELASLYAQCVDRWAPAGCAYQERKQHDLRSARPVEFLRGTLTALRVDYTAGALPTTFEQLVHAEVFDDLLGQAEHLLEEGYRLPAVVLGGAVLEEHLRQLAALHGVPTTKQDGTPLKATVINSDLHKASTYSQMERTQVEAWQKLRNDAAHNTADFQNVSDPQVKVMLSGVRDFMVRYPA